MTISSGPVPAAPRGLPHTPDPDWHDAPGHWSELLGRAGLVAYGIVHLLLAWLAASLAALGAMSPVDQGGAVAIVARSGILGRVLLVVATVCLVTFAVWQVRAGTVGFRWVEGRGLRRRKRIGAFAKALGVGGVAYLAVRVLVSGPGDGTTALALAGLGFAAYGLYCLVDAYARHP